MKLLNLKAIAFGTLFLGLAQTSATGFSLDAFTSFESPNTFQFTTIPAFSSQGTIANDTQSSLDSTVFGGSRTLQLTKLDNILTPNTAIISAFNGVAELSSPSYKTRAEIIWDGLDGSGSFQDIEIDGVDVQRSFQVNVESLNIGTGNGNLTLGFEIRDTSGNSATITQDITSDISSTTSLYFPYQDRVESGGSVNLQQIDYVRFYTEDENVGDDFKFNFIQSSEVVPFEFSPTLGLILGGGLFGFLKLKKKFSATLR